jgi:uncharacterized protein YdeI (YjbR/CyaY-like superfamily)
MARRPPGSVQPETRAAWRAWLAAHHPQPEGVWLVLWKKASGKPLLAYDDIVEEALAFGWVDSKTNALDDNRSMLWLAPRKPRSLWSRPNKLRVEEMLAAGLMAPAGLSKVAAAQADGSWTRLDAVEDGVVPEDLHAAFAQHPGAASNFDAFPRSARRGILEWIVQAKTAATRARRVEDTARLAAQNLRANQWKPPT